MALIVCYRMQPRSLVQFSFLTLLLLNLLGSLPSTIEGFYVSAPLASTAVVDRQQHDRHHRNCMLLPSSSSLQASNLDPDSDCNRPEQPLVSTTASTSPQSSRRGFISATSIAATTAAVTAATKLPGGAALAVDVTPTLPLSSTIAISSSSSINLPSIGLGAWAWGDSLFWGYDPKNDDELRQVYDYATSSRRSTTASTSTSGKGTEPGVLFDTAELYGLGVSEKLLGKFSSNGGGDDNNNVILATKFAALPFRTKASDVVKACKASVQRLGGKPIDLYQIHFPNAWSNEVYWDGLAQCYEKGLVKAVGVSNYGKDALRACHAVLKERGVPLSTNQIQLSLLYNHPLHNGLLETCDELGVKVLAYSPLALGFLTGKYTSLDNLPKGPRRKVGEKLLASDDYHNLMEVMQTISKKHGENATLSQVALNWAMAKGTIPIPGARTVRQVDQNYGALEWTLTKDEERVLDEASLKVMAFTQPDDEPFPKEDVFTKLHMFDS